MKIELNEPIKDFRGTTFNANDDGDEKITMKDFIVEALLRDNPGRTITGKQKLEYFALAKYVHENNIVELSKEDIIMIGERAADLWITPLYATAMGILNGME